MNTEPLPELPPVMGLMQFLGLLQFNDGLFPVGAYAHSFGMECYVQEGLIRDAAGVEAFIATLLECSAAPTDAVAALCVLRCMKAGDTEECLRLDHLLDAMKCAKEMREASRQMGHQTLRIASRLYPGNFLTSYFDRVVQHSAPGHHAIALGLVGSRMEWSPMEMAGAYLYSTSSALVNAAIRLLPLGQMAGQEILFHLQPLIARLASEVQETSEPGLWSFTPAQEIASMRHATLDARLFRS
jgi:urease accessory protein